MRHVGLHVLALSAFAILLGIAWNPAAAGKSANAGNGTLAVIVYACPPGIDAEEALPEACEPLPDGFGVRIYSREGNATPLTRDDAEAGPDGTEVWSGLIAGPGGTGYAVALNPLPDGAGSFVARGDVDGSPTPPGTAWPVTLSADSPDAGVAVYALAATGAEDPPEAEAVPFGAALLAGDCDDRREWVTSLGEVAFPVGPPVGDPAAVPVAQATVTVDVPLDEAIDGGYVVAIVEAPVESALVIACGEIGGADDDDGSLAVGLRPAADSGVVGIAYLAYNADDPAQTDVSLFLADGLGDD